MEDETRLFGPETKINKICRQFESQWNSANKPSLEQFLTTENSSLGSALVRRLIRIDIRYRWQNTERPDAGFYAAYGKDVQQIARQIIESSGEDPEHFEVSVLNLSQNQAAGAKSQVIGPYKLLQLIGEGGMGVVWLAEQRAPVQRRVALKLVKGRVEDRQIIARFEAERQALAMMDHPNIAKVLDAGTTDEGNPYFVMELVNGIPISEYCDRNTLTPRGRLELFVPVCKAVQHAHQKGIIHRDLKPSNILVQVSDGQPIAKVIDFGLAKALQHQTRLTDKTLFTEFGQVVGTLQYMSPEQATMDAMNIDTRSDIYSLGVVLYELLAGSTPLDKESVREKAMLQILEFIRETEPPRPSHRLSSSGDSIREVSELRQIQPSKLQQILRGELDWIVMKALEKDRTRRYETASDFAQDINNYLSGDSVNARPQSSWYQIQKFARKNKGLVASILAIGLVLFAGIAGTSFGLIRANQKAHELDKQNEKLKLLVQISIKAAKDVDQGIPPWERLEKIVDEILLLNSPVESGHAVEFSSTPKVRQAASQSFVALVDEDFDESVRYFKEAVEQLDLTPKEVGQIDLFSLEFITLIAKKLAASKTIQVENLVLQLSDLDQVWKELPYPADFNSVGRLMIVEALVDLNHPGKARLILDEIGEPLQSGRYLEAKKRADLILNNLKE